MQGPRPALRRVLVFAIFRTGVAGRRAPARARTPGPCSLPASPGVRARRPDCDRATIRAVAGPERSTPVQRWRCRSATEAKNVLRCGRFARAVPGRPGRSAGSLSGCGSRDCGRTACPPGGGLQTPPALEQKSAGSGSALSQGPTRDSPGPDCCILAMQKCARWPGLPTTLSTAALPVAEQSGRAGAATAIGVNR
jgi:hypothetical protein